MKSKQHNGKASSAVISADNRKSRFFTSANASSFFQPKLVLNNPGDSFEKEADRVAETVMRNSEHTSPSFFAPGSVHIQRVPHSMLNTGETENLQRKEDEPEEESVIARKASDKLLLAAGADDFNPTAGIPLTTDPFFAANNFSTARVSRKCSACEEEEQKVVQRKEDNANTKTTAESLPEVAANNENRLPVFRKCSKCEEEEKIQRQAIKGSTGEVPDSVSLALKSPGMPLDNATKAFMETNIGFDFSHVKVHNDSQAHRASKDINALAYAHKNHIVFGAGQYRPDTTDGKKLIAHELTHTIQQGGSEIKRSPLPPVSDQKRNSKIKEYDRAIWANQSGWRSQGHRYWNLFKSQRYTPYSTPNAYVNEVWKLQFQLGLTATGILDTETIDILVKTAQKAETDKAFLGELRRVNFNLDVIRRVQFILTKTVPDVQPLTSDYFRGKPQFEWINSNTSFVLKKSDKGTDVITLQSAFLALNYDLGPKGADGEFGDDTKKALETFQMDTGFPEAERDGKLGQKTLQALDTRLSSRTHKPVKSQPGGTVYGFEIPVHELVDAGDAAKSRAFLILTLKHIFSITEDQAITLVDVERWHWKNFSGVTQKDLDKGYKLISVSRKEYLSIAGEAADQFGVAPELSTEMKTKNLFWKLNGTDAIYTLSREVKELEKSKAQYQFWGIAFPAEKQKQLTAKQQALEAELSRVGITLADFNTLSAAFVSHFTAFAKVTALEMLATNERDTVIEMTKYKGGGSSTEGAEIKNILTDLAKLYKEADEAWWEGISLANTGRAGAITDFSSYMTETGCTNDIKNDFKPYCTEDIVEKIYGKYKFQERGTNTGFQNCFDKNLAAFEVLKSATLEKGYKILAYPKLNLRENAKVWKNKTPEEIEALLHSKSVSIKESIKETREAIEKDKTGEQIWKLRPVIEMAKIRLGVIKDSVQDKLIKAEAEKRADAEFWKGIGMAALGLGLGLLALASGPVGWAALAGSLIVGSIDAYNTFQDISFKRTAANTSFDPAKSLSDVEPGYFWFYVSLVSVGLDVFQGLKMIKGAAKAAQTASDAKAVKKITSEALEKEVDAINTALGSVAKGSKEEALLLEQLTKVKRIIDDLPSGNFERNVQILQKLKDYPQAVVGLANQMADPKIAEAFTAIEGVLKKAALSDTYVQKVLLHYAGSGAEFAHELPELVKVIQHSAVSGNKELLETLMTDPRLQKVVLDHAGNPDLLQTQWKAWQAAKAGGKLTTFEQFLWEQGFATRIISSLSLTDEFTAAFFKLSTEAQNRTLLRTIEPRLSDAYNAGNIFPKRLQAEFEKILSSDIIGETASLQRAQTRMKQALNLMGEAIQTHDEYAKVISLVDSAASRRAIFESATSVRGHEEFITVLKEADSLAKLKAKPGSFDEMIRIGPVQDADTIRWLIDQDAIRKLLANNPELVLALKKCASPCFPLLAKADEIHEILTMIKGTKGKIDYARLNQFMYEHRGSRKLWEEGMEKLRTNFQRELSNVVMPTAKDITLPSAWKTAIKNFARKTDALIKKGMAPTMLENIYRQASINGVDPTEFMENLSRAGNFLKKGDFDKLSSIFWALSSTKRSKFDAAYYLIKKIGDYGNKGPAWAEKIMTLFKFDDIADLRAATQVSDDLLAEVGDVSYASFEVLYKIASSFDGSRNEILQLIEDAGKVSSGIAGQPDIVRVAEALRQLGKGRHDYVTVATKLEDMKLLAAKLIAAGDDMGDIIWGTAKTGKKWKVAGQFVDDTGKVSGSKIIAHVKAKEPEIIKAIMPDGRTIDEAGWKAFRKAIQETDIPVSTQNNLVGALWEKVNLLELEAKFGKGKVWSQVKIRFTSGSTTYETIVDGIANDGGKIVFFEYKTGNAKLEAAQEAMKKLIDDGDSFVMEVIGPRANEIWPGGVKPPASYDVVRDPL